MESTIQASEQSSSSIIAPPSVGINSAPASQSSLLGNLTKGTTDVSRQSSTKPANVDLSKDNTTKSAYQNSRDSVVDVNSVREDSNEEFSLEDYNKEVNTSTSNKPEKTNVKIKIPIEKGNPDEEVVTNEATKETDKFDIDFNEANGDEQKKVETNKDQTLDQKLNNKKRDFTGFEAEDVETLKRLPNHLFDQYKTRLKSFYEAKSKTTELQKQVDNLKQNSMPESYYEHPDSYVLNPQYNKFVEERNLIDFEANHYRQQLVNVKSGKDWTKLTGYDNRTGQPIYELVKANEDGSINIHSEILLTQAVNQAINEKAKYDGAIQGLQQTHQNTYKQSLDAIRSADDKFFPAFKDITKLPTDVQNDFNRALGSIPNTFKQHPLAQMIAKAFAAHVYKDKQIAKLKQQLTTKNSIAEDSKAAGPSPTKFNGGQVNSGDKVVSLADFN